MFHESNIIKVNGFRIINQMFHESNIIKVNGLNDITKRHYVAASTHLRFLPDDLIMIQNWCHLYLIFHYPNKCMCTEALCIHVQ